MYTGFDPLQIFDEEDLCQDMDRICLSDASDQSKSDEVPVFHEFSIPRTHLSHSLDRRRRTKKLTLAGNEQPNFELARTVAVSN